jgi:hypothetical protein
MGRPEIQNQSKPGPPVAPTTFSNGLEEVTLKRSTPIFAIAIVTS